MPKRKPKSPGFARITPKKQMRKVLPASKAVKPPAPTVVQDSALLSLPPEILIHILSFLLINKSGAPVPVHSIPTRRWRSEIRALVDTIPRGAWRAQYQPEIDTIASAVAGTATSPPVKYLAVCRAFYHAGIAAYFENTFSLKSTTHLLRVATTLGANRRHQLAKVIVERDLRDDLGETLVPGGWTETHDPEALRLALQRLPAMKRVILDFDMGDGAPPFVWHRLLQHIRALRKDFDSISDIVFFAVNGQITNAEEWAVAK